MFTAQEQLPACLFQVGDLGVSVGLERGGIDADRFPFDQAGRAQALQHPCEDRDVFRDQSTGACAKSSSGPAVRSSVRPRGSAQRERVRRTPRDAALRIDALEVADQQQPEIGTGTSGRPIVSAEGRCRTEV